MSLRNLSIMPRRMRGRVGRPGRLARFTAVVIAAAAGCAHSRPAGAPVSTPGAADSATAARVGPIPVSVENRSTRDVVVYAVRGSIRRRLGSVPGLSRASLTVPDTFTGDRGGFTLVATAISSRESYVSDAVLPQASIRLVLTLEPRLASSALAVADR